MALAGTSGDIFPRVLQQGKAEEGSCGLGPQRACVLLLGSWGQSHLGSNHTQRVLFFVQKQRGEQEFNLAGALCV